MKGKAIAECDFERCFASASRRRTPAWSRASAARHGLDLPLFGPIRERMAQGAERHGHLDMSATYLTSAPR